MKLSNQHFLHFRVVFAGLFLAMACAVPSFGSSGTEGASFLDIPVGAAPAALGGAYSAMATDAYAPIYNPAGLGFLESNQMAAQYLSYLESINYEYFSFVHPVHTGLSVGGAIQYLSSGNIPETDANNNSLGSFTSHYGAYTLSVGQTINEKLSLGASAKWINAQIGNYSANAFAGDIGSYYRPKENLSLAAVVTNMGDKLTFLDTGDSLPLAAHLAAAYQLSPRWHFTAEGIYPQTGAASFHVGTEWSPFPLLALRAGYRTDTLQGLSPLAGVSTGFGIFVQGCEFAYAFMPYGDLGDTQYFSLVLRFGEAERAKRNLIHFSSIKGRRGDTVTLQDGSDGVPNWQQPDYQQLMQLLDDGQEAIAQGRMDPASKSNETTRN
jgi:hypothetical protein